MKHWHAEGSRKVVQNIVNTDPRKDRGRIFIRTHFDMPPRKLPVDVAEGSRKLHSGLRISLNYLIKS